MRSSDSMQLDLDALEDERKRLLAELQGPLSLRRRQTIRSKLSAMELIQAVLHLKHAAQVELERRQEKS